MPSSNEGGTTVEEREQSEFGAGVVVCLAKFSEHLNRQVDAIHELERIRKGSLSVDAASRFVRHTLDFEENWRRKEDWQRHPDSTVVESCLSEALHMWANAASDHFYDLDEERAPEPLRELAALTLEMGHGWKVETLWTIEHWQRVWELWRESCIALDEQLGTKPDWGQW